MVSSIDLVIMRSECVARILDALSKTRVIPVSCPVVDYVTGVFFATCLESVVDDDGTIVDADVVNNTGKRISLANLTWYSLRNLVSMIEKINVNR